ncbi:radical SAM protein [Anoxybacteroides tepidamans]|uniref:radical SAM protein n=1 Tax=Anoxybacteroides tepidamans TaxID=265948 RepID=UPI000482958D|nr:radical SAM protein [Anoxybacillus tepidamans]
MGFHYLLNVSKKQMELIRKHLLRRLHDKNLEKKDGLSIVYDLTYMCNQGCPGCCVSAIAYKKGKEITMEEHGSNTNEVYKILSKIKEFVDSRPELDFFLDFGGGELSLRPDYKDIIKTAASMFGSESIGMNTNGTLISIEDLLELDPYISYIGISIDGLEEYHNRWRKSVEGGNSFQRTMNLIKKMLEYPSLANKLDITTVPTKKNLHEIKELMHYLHSIGIKNYSVHRAMQVGRFWYKDDLVPSNEDYFKLFLEIIETGEELGMNVHLHHSIESIYTALLLGVNTYAGDNIGNPDRKASLAIDPWGRIFFDPWCTVEPWDKLAKSSLLNEDTTFEQILREHGGVQDLIDSYCRKDIRCKGCPVACSGGNRIASAANHIRSNFGLSAREVTKEHLLTAMDSVDPACPLYKNSSEYINYNDSEFQKVVDKYHTFFNIPQ